MNPFAEFIAALGGLVCVGVLLVILPAGLLILSECRGQEQPEELVTAQTTTKTYKALLCEGSNCKTERFKNVKIQFGGDLPGYNDLDEDELRAKGKLRFWEMPCVVQNDTLHCRVSAEEETK